jgi:hypothetical protein
MQVLRNPRLIIFVVLTVLAGLLYGNAATLLPVPWTDIPVVRAGVAPADLRWDLALMGASTGLWLAATFLILAWRPLSKPLLIQTVAVAIVLDACLEVSFRGPAYLLLAAPAVVVVAAYPRPRSLTEVQPRRRLRRPFIVLGVVTAAVLLARVGFAVWQQVDLLHADPSAELGWIDDAAHTVAIAVAALLAVTGRPGWRVVGALVGVCLCYLGITSLALPDARGSWGPSFAVLACLAGLAYLAAAARPRAVTVPAPSHLPTPAPAALS